ncbi:MAG: flagellar biosynthetic protein FliQ [Planctomycetota bacterium]
MHYDDSAVQLVRDVLILVLKLGGPVLIAGVVIGLFISIVQSVTSIQDQTLTFVPRIIGMIGIAVLLLPWMINRLVDFAREMFLLFG